MGSGLVEEEKIRGLEEEFDQSEAAFFAPAEDADIFEDVVTTEVEGAEDGAHGLLAHPAGAVHCFVEHGAADVERVGAMLREVTDVDVVPFGAGAGFQREDAGEDFQEG